MRIEVIEEEVYENNTSFRIDDFVRHYRQPIYSQNNESLEAIFASEDVVLRRFIDEVNGSHTPQCDILSIYEEMIHPSFIQWSTRRGTFQIERSGIPVLVQFEKLLQSRDNATGRTGRLARDTASSMILQLSLAVSAVQSASFTKETSIRVKTGCINALFSIANLALECCNVEEVPEASLRRLVCALLGYMQPRRLVEMDENLATRLLDLSLYANEAFDCSDIQLQLPEVMLGRLGLDDFGLGIDDSMRQVAESMIVLIGEGLKLGRPEADPDKTLIRRLLERLDMTELAKAVRSHFFARDDKPGGIVETRERLHMGFEVKEPSALLDSATKPYRDNHNRKHSALAFMALSQQVSVGLLDEILPVVYELLDSSNEDDVCWAAAGILHLLSCPSNSPTLWTIDVLVATENLLTILHGLIQSFRSGRVLSMLGVLQRKIFEILFAHPDTAARYVEPRRKATKMWLLIVLQNNRHFTKDYLVFGVMLGAAVPLLYDHSVAKESGDALELIRIGLSALLPLLQVSDTVMAENIASDWTTSHGDGSMVHATHLTAMIALSSLLLAAYPSTVHHGGKITYSLIHFLRANCDHEETAPCSACQLAWKVGARLKTFGGERATSALRDILVGEDKDGSVYDDRVCRITTRLLEEANQTKQTDD